jgi:uncharacterized protein (TIGR04552 family)
MEKEKFSSSEFQFDQQALSCIVGGLSAIDIPRLRLTSEESARQFLVSYGFDLSNENHAEQLWATYRRAVSLIEEHLAEPGEVLPRPIAQLSEASDIIKLLLFASHHDELVSGLSEVASREPELRQSLQVWSCAILRVMHVDVHLRNDLFGAFRDEIQTQILKPLQDAIVEDDIEGCSILGPNLPNGHVRLHKFEIKPFKTTSSAIIKLLARPDRVALQLLDKLGVRFVTRSVFDSFRVIRFLAEQHLVSFPHIIPDQSNNTLYPMNLFTDVMQMVADDQAKSGELVSAELVRDRLEQRMVEDRERARFLDKPNEFSDPDYRFIKFINRKLITVSLPNSGGGMPSDFRFFYPFEIQIVDQETDRRNSSGALAHSEYKKRQRMRARRRVFGLDRENS